MLKSFIILGSAVANKVSLSKPKNPPSNIVIIITNFALRDTNTPPYFPFLLSQHYTVVECNMHFFSSKGSICTNRNNYYLHF